MTPKEGIEILETIAELYPRFEVTKRKARMLLPQLEKMEYEGVLTKLSEHVAQYPYPPSLSEIAVYQPESNKHLEEMKKWREESRKVSPKVKEQFHEAMTTLIKQKAIKNDND